MATPINPKKVSWEDSTTAVDQTGAVIPWDASTNRAGVAISFDGVGAVSVPVTTGVKQFDLTTLAAYKALGAGSHKLALAEVTKEGVTGQFAADVTFLVAFTPSAPTAVALV